MQFGKALQLLWQLAIMDPIQRQSQMSRLGLCLLVLAQSIESLQPLLHLATESALRGRVFLPKACLLKNFYPLINAAEANAANATTIASQYCEFGTLDPKKVTGKIVLCLGELDSYRLEKGYEALLAGAVGLILVNTKEFGNNISADAHILPAAHVSYADGLAIYAYMKSTTNSEAFLTRVKSVFGTTPAPSVADFSSRGPNPIEPSILKPDIIAPGVSIVAAFSPAASPTESLFDNRHLPFNVISGTSMATPHVAGIVGLLKALHPDWSPASILSALITNARLRGNDNWPIIDLASKLEATLLDFGAGHMPQAAHQILDSSMI